MTKAIHDIAPRLDWRARFALLVAAPALAGCSVAYSGGSGGGSGAASAEASPSTSAAASQEAASPSCLFRKLSLEEMASVANAGSQAQALTAFQQEDIDSVGLMEADGGPTAVRLIEFTGSAGLSPAKTGDEKLIQTSEVTQAFAGSLGIPRANLDLNGETGFQSGNGGVKVEEPAGTVAMIWAHAGSNICNMVAYPNGRP